MTTYTARKLTGRCVRAGCRNECQEDHLLCVPCADDHRRANRQYVNFTRKQMSLPFIHSLVSNDSDS